MTSADCREPAEAFERAWIAVSYVLGRRGEALTEGFVPQHPRARGLVRGLAHPERSARAEVLAVELARLVCTLHRRRLA